MTAPVKRPYQLAAVDAVRTAMTLGQRRLLVQMATGLGKTVFFSGLPSDLAPWLAQFPQRERKMLVIAHREELLDQAAGKLHAQHPELTISIEQGDRHALASSDIIVASIQTLAAGQFRRLHRLLARHTFRIVVIDEAHHAAATSYRTTLMLLGFLPPAAEGAESLDAPTYDDVKVMEAELAGWDAIAPKDRLLIGVTATPNRSDAVGLGCVFQSIVYTYSIRPAIADGWLVPIEPWVVETQTDLGAVRTTHGEFNQKDLAEAVNTERRNELAIAAWNERAKGLPTLAFTVDVAHAQSLARAFSQHGISAAMVSGETDKDERRQILRDFQARKIDVLANCMVFTEGTDLPLTECILHAKPTKSTTLYTQMTGRGLRPNPGKTRCVVIDLVDVARRHSLQTAPVLYGLPPGLIVDEGRDLKKVEDELAALLAQYPQFNVPKALENGPLTLAQLRAKASTFDLWTIPSLGQVATFATMSWIKVSEDTYRLQYPWEDGAEVLTVQKDMLGHFEVAATFQPGAGVVRQRTVAMELKTVAEAVSLAERYVQNERRTVARMVDRMAAWKQKAATPGQLGMLRRLKVPIRPGMNSGEASQLIDLAKARGGR